MENIDIFELLYPTYKIKKPIRLIELFAGIGSQAKALEILGTNFEHYQVVEFDKYAIASYNAIHNTNFLPTDITKISADDLNIVYTDKYDYVLTYSFPCQDLSLAGKRKGMEKGNNTRSGLLWEVERILCECIELPQILLMENVPQVLGSANAKDFRKWQLKLEELGYSNYVSLLNSKDYGIPQNRNRCFMISVLGQYNYTFPKPIPLKLRLKDLLEKEVDEKYYLSKTHLNNFLKHRKDVEDDVCEVKQLGNCMPSKNRDNPNQGRIYDVDGLSPTITTMEGGNRQPMIIEEPITRADGITDGGVILNQSRIRKLTPLECWRLMGFSDQDFYKAAKVNSNSQLYKQAGNSIVVNVLVAIFQQFLEELK
ncbi:MAG: DNA (cytosine-5-)-methyltransferase [Beduini sp.]|uniref:DNA (cytosine-5-)-methyltransferase n=1 Tax=Beduini sp. TaxID=1922300 RepID=UPI0039908DE0